MPEGAAKRGMSRNTWKQGVFAKRRKNRLEQIKHITIPLYRVLSCRINSIDRYPGAEKMSGSMRKRVGQVRRAHPYRFPLPPSSENGIRIGSSISNERSHPWSNATGLVEYDLSIATPASPRQLRRRERLDKDAGTDRGFRWLATHPTPGRSSRRYPQEQADAMRGTRPCCRCCHRSDRD